MDRAHTTIPPRPFGETRALVGGLLNRVLQALIHVVTVVCSGNNWSVKTAALAVVTTLVFGLSSYKGMQNGFKPDLTIEALEWQIRHPLVPLPYELKTPTLYEGTDFGRASHNEKLELRLTVPFIGKVTKTGPWTVLVWSHVAGVIVFWLLARVAADILEDRVGASLFVLGLCPTFFAFRFFNDFTCGDGIAWVLILLCIAVTSWWSSGLYFLASAFSDERCVACVPLLLLYIAIRSGYNWRDIARRGAGLGIGVIVWLILRLWLRNSYQLSTGRTGMLSFEVLRYHLTVSLPWVFLGVFGSSWLLPGLTAIGMGARRRWAELAAFLAAFACAAAPAIMVWDFNRSMAYTFPILLISLHSLRGDQKESRQFLALIASINIVLMGASILRSAFFVGRMAAGLFL